MLPQVSWVGFTWRLQRTGPVLPLHTLARGTQLQTEREENIPGRFREALSGAHGDGVGPKLNTESPPLLLPVSDCVGARSPWPREYRQARTWKYSELVTIVTSNSEDKN